MNARLVFFLYCLFFPSYATATVKVLLICNQDYSKIPQLKSPFKDINQFEKLLKEKGHVKNFTKICDVSAKNMESMIIQFSQTLNPEEDVAIVFYAGHGGTINSIETLWGVDFNPKTLDGYIETGKLARYIAERVPLIAFIDACRTKFSKPLEKNSTGGKAIESLEQLRGKLTQEKHYKHFKRDDYIDIIQRDNINTGKGRGIFFFSTLKGYASRDRSPMSEHSALISSLSKMTDNEFRSDVRLLFSSVLSKYMKERLQSLDIKPFGTIEKENLSMFDQPKKSTYKASAQSPKNSLYYELKGQDRSIQAKSTIVLTSSLVLALTSGISSYYWHQLSNERNSLLSTPFNQSLWELDDRAKWMNTTMWVSGVASLGLFTWWLTLRIQSSSLPLISFSPASLNRGNGLFLLGSF